LLKDEQWGNLGGRAEHRSAMRRSKPDGGNDYEVAQIDAHWRIVVIIRHSAMADTSWAWGNSFVKIDTLSHSRLARMPYRLRGRRQCGT
jgi:hypothetical protein